MEDLGEGTGRTRANEDADQAAHEAADEDDPGNVVIRHDSNRSLGETADELLPVDNYETDDGAADQRLDRPVRDDRKNENDQRRD